MWPHVRAHWCHLVNTIELVLSAAAVRPCVKLLCPLVMLARRQVHSTTVDCQLWHFVIGDRLN